MGWLRKKAKQIGKGIKKIGSKIAGAVRKVTRTKAFKIIAAIALATIVGPAAWQTWGALEEQVHLCSKRICSDCLCSYRW
jgi:hypothetical protein